MVEGCGGGKLLNSWHTGSRERGRALERKGQGQT